ncbi:Protein KBP-like protein [Diplonema papillatum]|nr:Protein KBP-like protein [Diplonema papillatum]
MSWASLLTLDSQEEADGILKRYARLEAEARALAGQEAEGREVNVNTHRLEAIARVDDFREKAVASWDHSRGPALRATQRVLLESHLLLSELHAACSEALTGHKHLDHVKNLITTVRAGGSLAPSDFDLRDSRHAAAAPCFEEPGPPATLAFTDVYIATCNRMGLVWASWGDPATSLRCFRKAEELYEGFLTATGCCGAAAAADDGSFNGTTSSDNSFAPGKSGSPTRPADDETQIEELVTDATARLRSMQARLDEDRTSQQNLMARTLEQKRLKKRSKSGPPTEAAPAEPADDCGHPPPPPPPHGAAALQAEPADAPLHHDACEGLAGGEVTGGQPGADAAASEQRARELLATAQVGLAGPAEVADCVAAVETRYTETCMALGQLYKHQGDPIHSCYYCHVALQRQLRLKAGVPDKAEWITNCLDLSAYYVEAKDFSHAEHCINAVEMQQPHNCINAVEMMRVKGSDEHLDAEIDFTRARWATGLLALLDATKEHEGKPSIVGMAVPLFMNPLALPGPEELALLKEDPGLVERSARRIVFRLPISPPRVQLVVRDGLFEDLFGTADGLFRRVTAVFTVDTDCEKHCIIHLERASAIAAYAKLAAAGLSADARRDLQRQRAAMLRRLLDDDLDELVFRNVLRQVHFGLGCAYQDLAAAAADQGAPAEAFEPHLAAAAEHFGKFTARFVQEFKDIQKATTNAKEKSAFLKLEGSAPPPFLLVCTCR